VSNTKLGRSQSRSAREDPQGSTTLMMGTGPGAPKVFSRRITESCADGTIIVIIMNLWNCRFSVTIEND